METITSIQMLKSVINGLSNQSTASVGQKIMLYAADGTPVGKMQAPTEQQGTAIQFEENASATAATTPSATAAAGTMGYLYLVGPKNGTKYQWITVEDDSATPSTYSWLQIGSTSIDLSQYATLTVTDALQAALDALEDSIEGLQDDLEDGTVVPALAENLASWEGQTNTVDDVQTDRVFTSGGDESIDSSVSAIFSDITAVSDASMQKVMTSGKNLLRLESNNGWAKAVGTGWYIMVPALPYGEIGKAIQPNGLLLCTDSGETKTVNGFTYERGVNLKTATVRFKKLSDGVPTSVSDGSACAYTDASDAQGNSYRFYNCTEPGYIIISGITFAQTCARIAWSGGADFPYDMFVGPTDSNDAGNAIDLTAALAACQPGGRLLVVGGEGDRISRESATSLRWTRINSHVQPSWTNTLQDDGATYLHEATITGMKADGKAEFENDNVTLVVNGTNISYTDTTPTASTDYVKYQLDTPATGTVSVTSTSVAVEDYGLMAIYGGNGDVKSTFVYGQGMPDTLRAMATVKIFTLRDEVTALSAQMGQQTEYADPVVEDIDYMPMLGGQPAVLFSDGAPTTDNKPTNWIDCVDGGYEWTGLPNVVGQHVRDITNGKDYYGWKNPSTDLLEWK